MTIKTLIRTSVLLLQLLTATFVHAQLLDDIEIKREGNKTILFIRFVTPIQYQNAAVTKSGDLAQIAYTIIPTGEKRSLITSERRLASNGKVPELTVTDTSTTGTEDKRELLVRFSKPIRLQVQAGRENKSIEITLDESSIETFKRYFITLQSTPDGSPKIAASIPSSFQQKEVFTASRVINGETWHSLNLGYFETQADAEAARSQLISRFPDALVQATDAPTNTSMTTSAAQPTLTTAINPEVDVVAADLLAKAVTAYDLGNYANALETLNSLLNLATNSSTRKGHELAGQTRLQLGDKARARSEFELFLKLYPEGSDSEQVRQILANLPAASESPKSKPVVESTSTTSGSVSMFYYGGQSKVRTIDFQNSPLNGLPVLQSDNSLSTTDQKQVQTNVDLNWRYRDADKDMRFVVRDTHNADMMPNRPNTNRLSALYFEHRSMVNGTNVRVGRQSPNGGGVLYRFDGIQAGYSFAPKWKLNAVYGVPTDALLDTKRNFYGLSVDAEALTKALSGSFYLIQQTIDREIDRRALGTEMRYFNGGTSVSGQLDYDQVLRGLNIMSLQGTWQLPDTTVYNLLYDRRAAPIRSLGNVLFFQDPALLTPARRISDLLGTTSLNTLRDQVNSITALQNQAMAGVTTPISSKWQTGANINYTNVGEIKPVAVILPTGQASTGNLWSLGMQLIGSNLYSTRDTHVFNLSVLAGPTYNGRLLSYNNLSGLSEYLQLETALRFYSQSDTAGIKTVRATPSVRMTYRVLKQVSLESEISYELARRSGPLVMETSTRSFYYVGARYDF